MAYSDTEKANGEQCETYVVRYTGRDGKRHIETH
jgi:hypothetical protein